MVGIFKRVGNSKLNSSALSSTICCCLLYSQQLVYKLLSADAALFSAAAITAHPCHIELKLLSAQVICCHLLYSHAVSLVVLS